MTATFNIQGKPAGSKYWDSEDKIDRWRVDVMLKTGRSMEVVPPRSSPILSSSNESIEGDPPQPLTSDPFIDALSTVIRAMSINSKDREKLIDEPPTPAYVGEQLTQVEFDNLNRSTIVVASERPPTFDNKSTSETLRTRKIRFTTKRIPAPYRCPDEQSIEPRHDDYFTYAKYQTNLAYGMITFFIEGRTEGGAIYPGPGFFDVTANSLSGRSCTVSVKLDSSKSRYICSFTAVEPGVYEVIVQLLYPEPRHINGSPFQITVCRDYNISKPRLTIKAIRPKRKNKDNPPPVKCWGIDVDVTSDKIYMINKETNSVRVLSTHGSKLLQFGKRERDNGHKLYRPTGIAVDAINRRIVISDKDNHRICFWSLDGEFLRSFGTRGDKDGEFYYPWGIAVSPNGIFIAVADSKNQRIQIFDKFGNFLRKFSDTGTNSSESKKDLKSPRGISFDKAGENIYVTDFYRHAVYILDLDLTQKRFFAPPKTFLGPQGLTVDLAGNVLICDSRNHCVQVLSPDGTFLSKISGDDEFMPQDLAILRDGQVAVLDVNGRIHIY